MNRSHLAAGALALAIAGLVAGTTVAVAQGTAPSRSKIDANGDGAIDRAEAAAHPRMAEKFDQLDRNRDGRIDASERPQRHGKRHGRGGHDGMGGIAKLDGNADGRISKVEAAAQPRLAERFDAADRNRDGYLVRSELQAMHAQRRAEFSAQRQQRMDQAFTEADANRDGRLSRAEVESKMPRLAQQFAFLDEDRDGYLSRADLAPPRR